jgi:hypothetical protein
MAELKRGEMGHGKRNCTIEETKQKAAGRSQKPEGIRVFISLPRYAI